MSHINTIYISIRVVFKSYLNTYKLCHVHISQVLLLINDVHAMCTTAKNIFTLLITSNLILCEICGPQISQSN